MGVVTEEIWSFVSDPSSLYHRWHFGPKLEPELHLKPFLFSTMDEVRLRRAAEYILTVLAVSDAQDAGHFLAGVLRREISGDISYPKQRDHSAHVLYNYLLGWYIYGACPSLRTALGSQFALRGWSESDKAFYNVWPFVSILHDIGYLFEGGLAPLSTSVQHRQVTIGADVAREYFAHHFWSEARVNSVDDRRRILRLSGVEVPAFSDNSFTGVADGLRSLGHLERLRAAVRNERDSKRISSPTTDILNKVDGLPGDTFDLWRAHYEYFGQTRMVNRIESAQNVFDSLLRHGIGNTGLRVLDHGVCGGLLLMLYSTFYYSLWFGLPSDAPPDPSDAAAWRRFRRLPDLVVYEAWWWWSVIVWATAATAIHNTQQQQQWPHPLGRPAPLDLEEDALAYLGILVDILQEWDRYSVTRASVIGGGLPIQAVDVRLSNAEGKIVVAFGDSAVVSKVRDSLNIALNRWTDLLDLQRV